MTDRLFGWRPDVPDVKDPICKIKAAKGVTSIDLRDSGFLPEVQEVANTAAAVGFAVSSVIEYGLKAVSSPKLYTPSELFIYYNARVMDGTQNNPNAGASIRNGCRTFSDLGAPPEDYWPFNVYRVVEKPDQDAYNDSVRGLVKKYERVVNSDPANITAVLSNSIPVIFGMSIYDSFMTATVAKNGKVKMPTSTDTLLGGHVMTLVGYNSTSFIARNVWGSEWGDNGYCYIPYDYLTNTNMADDFWAITLA